MAPPEALSVTAALEPVQVLGKKEDGKELAFLSTFYFAHYPGLQRVR